MVPVHARIKLLRGDRVGDVGQVVYIKQGWYRVHLEVCNVHLEIIHGHRLIRYTS